MVCCFFGHSDTPQHIFPQIEAAVEKLIRSGRANEFLVGNQGQFDRMTLAVLRRMKERYPQITYRVVLPYMPKVEAQAPVMQMVRLCFRKELNVCILDMQSLGGTGGWLSSRILFSVT